ncbi:MAG: hypothetical protein AAGA42_16400 [Actinomycetota bacterium]
MRRSPGGLLLLISMVLFALAISLWWFGRVAFTPVDDTSTSLAILDDSGIRGEIATVIASADAPTLNQSPTQLKEFIEQLARIPDGAALMSQLVASGHERLIGERTDPVQVSAEEQVVIVRDERVGEMPPITLPVQEVGTLSVVQTGAFWVSIGAAVSGVILLIAAVVVRPERGEISFAFGAGLGALAIFLVVFGYLTPLTVLPAISDTTWMGVFPRLAQHNRALTLGVALAAIVLASITVFATASLRQRRQWSTPLAVGRYRDDHRWSR